MRFHKLDALALSESQKVRKIMHTLCETLLF
jgi:hypothetical protein